MASQLPTAPLAQAVANAALSVSKFTDSLSRVSTLTMVGLNGSTQCQCFDFEARNVLGFRIDARKLN